eukprot:Rhum_TRINITY_DN14915_c1_g1::Rhum_TRINITY_DN14915_c1_g1_i1::g.127257::m.127257
MTALFAPDRLLDDVTLREMQPVVPRGTRVRAINSKAFAQLLEHHPNVLHDSAQLVYTFLRQFNVTVCTTRGIRALHAAAKKVQRRMRVWIARKAEWKVQVSDAWRRSERVQRERLMAKLRPEHLTEYLVCLCHQHSDSVNTWQDVHGRRCYELTMAYRGFVQVINQLRRELVHVRAAGDARGESGVRGHLQSLERQRMELVVALMVIPTRPAFPWGTVAQNVQWLLTRRRRAARAKVESAMSLFSVHRVVHHRRSNLLLPASSAAGAAGLLTT